MRIALVVHAFPPESRTGVETYSEALACALGRAGHDVHVFAPRRDEARAYLAQTRELREGYSVTWLALERDPDDAALRRARPGVPAAFARFLEREQPEVVHFQHLKGLGPELVDEARERGLVTVLTAHDPYLVCNDHTLLAPDLTPLEPGDLVAEARCERARGLLDRALPAHDGFLPPGCSDEELRGALERELHGPVEDEADLARRVARLRLERDERLAAASRCDRVEAPTAWLAELLMANGLRTKVARRACGHDVSRLRELPPVEARHEGPLQVLYLGGLYEHKGVHVLLDAAARLGAQVELRLRGCHGSSDYHAQLAVRATEVGAELGGPFERDELPALLEAADVVVLPSLWPENAPFVIREAFAAGRPVIASDSRPLRESVRSGVDGRLVPVGDAAALAACLGELAQDRGELFELCAGVRAPRGIESDARELVGLYEELAEPYRAQRERARERLPAHLAGFAAAYDELESLPTRELVARAFAGLDELAPRLGQPSPDLAGALLGSDRLRERVADLARAASWREDIARDREQALRSLEERVSQARESAASEAERAHWRAQLLGEREARLAWTESRLEDRQRAVLALEARSEELGRALEAQREELSWTRECLEDRRAHLAEAERRLADTCAALEAALAERDELRVTLEGREQELSSLTRDHLELGELLERLEEERGETARSVEAELGVRDLAHAQLLEAYERLCAAHEALREHDAWLRAELQRALRPLLGESVDDRAEGMGAFLSHALERLRELTGELTWRAEEMSAAGHDVRGLGERLLHGPLLRRVASWREPGDPAARSEP